MLHQDPALQLPDLEAILLSKDTNTAARMNALGVHAKAYIDFNNLAAARRDAILMLRTNRTDGRGYVKSAQIERLAGDLPAAVEWYDHGLRRVPETDHLYSYMREERIKTIVLSRPTDPVTVLPEEILEFVLSYIDYRDIARSLRVSKLWTEILSTIRPISETIDFRLCSGTVSTLSTDVALKRVRKSAKALHFANLSDSARRLLKFRLEMHEEYPKLQKLSLNGLGLVTLPFSRFPLKSIQITDGSGLEMAVIVNILKTCKELEIAKFTNVLVPGTLYPDHILVQDFRKGVIISNVLKVLHISCEVGDIVLESVLPCFPSLTEVEYCSSEPPRPHDGRPERSCDLSGLESLRKLRLHNVVCTLPKLLASLRAWGSTSCRYTWPNGQWHDRYHHLSNLRIVDMSNCSGKFLPSQFLPPHTVSALTHLNCTGLRGSVNMVIPLDLLENLRVLRVSGNMIEPYYTRGISHLRDLEELHITSSSVPSVEAIHLLKSAGPCLQYVRCKDCPNITPDVIKFAESKGITMVLRNTDSGIQPRRRHTSRVGFGSGFAFPQAISRV